MKNLDFSALRTFVNQVINNGKTQFGWSVLLATEPQLKAPKSNPLAGRVQKISIYQNADFGDYGNKVTANGNGATAKPKDMGYVHESNGVLSTKTLKDGTTQLYMSMMLKSQTKSKVGELYLVDGQVTPFEEIAEYLTPKRPKTATSTQREVGITDANAIDYYRPKAASVIAIVQSETKCFFAPDQTICLNLNEFEKLKRVLL